MARRVGADRPETPGDGAVRRATVVSAVVVAGPPGGGKSTAARRLAGLAAGRGQPLAMLDQDTMTGPLTRVVARLAGRPADDLDDLDDPTVRGLVREPGYAALLGVARDVLRGGAGCLLVAPFTGERRDPARWDALAERLHSAGAGRVVLVWVTCPPGVLLQRLRARGAPRDRAKLADPAWVRGLDLDPPAVPHLRVDSAAPPAELDRRLAAVATSLTEVPAS
jgi:predicted kinase